MPFKLEVHWYGWNMWLFGWELYPGWTFAMDIGPLGIAIFSR
jgi:hypothetical protein